MAVAHVVLQDAGLASDRITHRVSQIGRTAGAKRPKRVVSGLLRARETVA
jgi:hypothetical protein